MPNFYLKHNHPLMKKFLELEEAAERIGISINCGRDGYTICDNETGLVAQIKEVGGGSWEEPISCFPSDLDYKLVINKELK